MSVSLHKKPLGNDYWKNLCISFYFLFVFKRTLNKASYIFLLFSKLAHFAQLHGFFLSSREKQFENLEYENKVMRNGNPPR